ncbi:MAG: HAMP domain-containing histidine kinase [Sulfuricurvum sp.]|jgi:two-component system NtrC family sensor kinase/two-component system sensor histidine kinase AtoS|uniref:sensor histidine kinase n=1 Tax=Sulfuricurvum sp. TaxID=2025608 RepID=UPI0025CD729B|nr:HAMP domain-containing sensor histidine kinase [Sulfuricurvum sp.]MCK9372506.1 HAMP domain-containing histidine kinase [Sulfuricurvum sp.]
MSEMISAEELKALIDQTYKVEEEYVALRQSYAHLQSTIEQVIEFLPNAIWIVEPDGSIFLQNSQAKGLDKLFETLRWDEQDYEVAFEERSFLIKSALHNEKHLLSATDITDQKRKENLATMGQMAAHLSHEIRNPIGSIALLASTLMKRVKEENKPIVTEIQKSLYRIERIIKATLMFSKGVSAQKGSLRWWQIREALESAIGYYSYGKKIDFCFPDDDFDLVGDLDLLVMLFSNFIFNAVDAIELDENEDGVIELTYRCDERYHIFEIYDSGIAIENKKWLFEAFKSTKERGNGLGLVLAKNIAQAHGGEITVCEGERKGFCITLAR